MALHLKRPVASLDDSVTDKSKLLNSSDYFIRSRTKCSALFVMFVEHCCQTREGKKMVRSYSFCIV